MSKQDGGHNDHILQSGGFYKHRNRNILAASCTMERVNLQACVEGLACVHVLLYSFKHCLQISAFRGRCVNIIALANTPGYINILI